ncbi:MAG: hypothetical protein KAI79_16900, partial [Bacteroidales bacterium]|nr:hypothetical protein [Bacteroidales bacterium]
LLGDFAFVIWDNRNKKVFCARDRFGMRQLYFSQVNNSLIISNSLNTINQHPSISKKLNDKSIDGFLLYGDHTWLDKSVTVFQDVTSLLPAHKLIFQNGKIKTKKYWDISSDLPLIKYQKKSDYLDHFREIFKTAIEDRIRTPSIAVSMSGGMDSTSIAATVRELEKGNRVQQLNIQAITSVYDHLFSSKERYYTKITAEHLNLPVHYLPADYYPTMEQSILTTRPLEIYNQSYWQDFEKTIATYSRVVLTGDAGDNLLKYSPAISSFKENNPLDIINDIRKLRKQYGNMPTLGLGIRSFLRRNILKDNQVSTRYSFPDWINPEFNKKMELESIWYKKLNKNEHSPSQRHPGAYHSLLNPEWNTDDKYMKTNFSMSEKRDPFLDLRLIEFIFSIPATPWLFNKHILRESMKEILPQEIINRPKAVLGNIHTEMIKKSELNQIDNWEEAVAFSNYILKEKIPPFLSKEIDENSLYINLRTLLLNNWLNLFFISK